MKRLFSLLLTLLCVALAQPAFAAKTVKIKLTGTAHEKILMTVGNTGRTEVISRLPYVLEVPKAEMPIHLSFQSENYLYYSIDVPKKPFDTTGHVYLIKINENEMALRNNRMQPGPSAVQTAQMAQAPAYSEPIEGLDLSQAINAAPVTGNKAQNTLALIIANEKYEMASNVDNATNDGLAFKEYCLKTLGIPASNVKYHSNLSFGKMRKAINDMVEITNLMGPETHLIVYYAGHGIPDNKTKDAFIMPVDADGADTDVCISLGDFYEKLNSTSAQQCVVFLDACFSGAQRGGDMIMAARGVKIKPQPAAPKGKTIVFSATSGEEAAYSYKEESHGLFTYFLLKKLQESKGKTTLGDLAEYLQKNVSVQSRLINNMPQSPTVTVAPTIADGWKSFKIAK